MADTYAASRIKRRRGKNAEMEERAQFYIAYARMHGPVTVRGLYYQAEINHVAGIDKSDQAYDRVQGQVLKLRRQGRLDYKWIADATRWMRKPRTYSSIEDALQQTARTYRRALWNDASEYVEIWAEKDAIAGVIYEVTQAYDVPLMVARGFASETFCFEAVAQRADDRRPYHVYYLGDFDRAGVDAARSLNRKLSGFAAQHGIDVHFETLGVTREQVHSLRLPTREPKRKTAADRRWPYDFACEVDALPPDVMRAIVEAAILRHLPRRQISILRAAEDSERAHLTELAKIFAGEDDE
jgi:hypothetical protein